MTEHRGLTRRQVIKGGAAGLAAGLAAGALPGVTRAAGRNAPLGLRNLSTPGGGNSITMFGWDIADTSAGLGKGFQAVKEAWEADTGNTVTFDGVPFENFVSAGTTRARAGELSDTLELLPDLNHAGIFPALQPTAKADYGALADEVTGWDAAIIDLENPEAFAGIPGGAQGTLWYYNKALFEAAGLDPDTPPATWAEFEEACTKLAEAGTTPLGMSGTDGNLLWWGWLSFSPQFFTTAEEVLKVRSGEIKLNDERFLQSLQPIASTYDRAWWNEDYASKKFADIEAAFGAGQMGIVPGLITSAMNWKAFDGTLGDGNYGVFPSPLVDGGLQQGQFFNPVLLYAISKDAEDVETSRSWISAIVSKEGQELMLEQSGQFPNRTDVDVTTLANSQGAARIKEIVEEVGGVPVAQNQFNSAALGAATQNITSAAVSGDLQGFLDNLESLQRS
jgi:ABC-type glycerol-3-phosphate transport system substrate-binding protein